MPKTNLETVHERHQFLTARLKKISIFRQPEELGLTVEKSKYSKEVSVALYSEKKMGSASCLL